MGGLSQKKERSGKESLVDTAALMSWSLLAGATTDYASGLRGLQIIASRALGVGSNVPTAAPYGKWRNILYKSTRTTDKSSRVRKYLVDLLAFDTFQVPLYAGIVGLVSFTSNMYGGEASIDWDKVAKSAGILTAVSPFIGPITGLWMDGFRKLFGLKSAPKKAGESLALEESVEVKEDE